MAGVRPRQQAMPRFSEREQVDFVVIGSGAAGGVIAKELSTAGFNVVVLEQGGWARASDFKHDERNRGFPQPVNQDPQSFRRSVADPPQQRGAAFYLRVVGGTSVHFTANYWRFREIDFIERSVYGPIEGTGLADWPITYAELEPYYTKVDWEIGVSGAPGPHDPPRSRPYPVPPLPVKSSGVILERAAQKLGWHPFPAPMAILSQSHNNRIPCQHCGYCMGFGCEYGAKSSSLASVIPVALATGRCEIRAQSTVARIETDQSGRVTEVVYFDAAGAQHAQRARAVVLSANGAETPRLLLMSDSSLFPHGLANSSGKVGLYLMGNGQEHAYAVYEHPLNEHKSVQVSRIIWDFYDSDASRGFYGGGGMDARFQFNPIGFARGGLPPGSPRWGTEYKRMLGQYFNYMLDVNGHTTDVPLETNTITLDPSLRDSYGRPALCVTADYHPYDIAIRKFFLERCVELVEASGALRTWTRGSETEQSRGGFAHLLGTCRMGNDPRESVVDKYHRAHDVPNLFICDGSSLVSSGRGQPTMTIQALAFRAGDHIAQFAKRGEI